MKRILILNSNKRRFTVIKTTVYQVQNPVEDIVYIIIDKPDGFTFEPGSWIPISIPDVPYTTRPYSIMSGPDENYIWLMVKVIKNGVLSPKLAQLKYGDEIRIGDPVNQFKLPSDTSPDTHHFMFATGVGIAPFLSYLSNPPLAPFVNIYWGCPTLAHATHWRSIIQELPPNNSRIAISRENPFIIKKPYAHIDEYEIDKKYRDHFHIGRITDLIRTRPYPDNSKFYLCGSQQFIDEVYNFLEIIGVNSDDIYYETFFNFQ